MVKSSYTQGSQEYPFTSSPNGVSPEEECEKYALLSQISLFPEERNCFKVGSFYCHWDSGWGVLRQTSSGDIACVHLSEEVSLELLPEGKITFLWPYAKAVFPTYISST